MSVIFSLLRESALLYKANASTIAGYLAWLLIPFAGFVLLSFVPNEDAVFVGGTSLMLAELFLWIWISIFLTLLIDKLLASKAPDHAKLQDQAWKLIAPVLLVALIEFAAVIGGLILLIIPGLIFAIWFAFAQLAVILDKRRGVDALVFSRSLVQGKFFRSAALIVTGPFLVFFLYALAMGTLVMLASEGDLTAAEIFFTEEAPLWYLVTDTLVQIFITTPITLIYSIQVYRLLKTLAGTGKKRDGSKEV